jgi:hypothetical protein
MINEKTKLILALNQVENVVNLLDGNEYEKYMCAKLNGVYYELQRQITNLTAAEQSTTIKK